MSDSSVPKLPEPNNTSSIEGEEPKKISKSEMKRRAKAAAAAKKKAEKAAARAAKAASAGPQKAKLAKEADIKDPTMCVFSLVLNKDVSMLIFYFLCRIRKTD